MWSKLREKERILKRWHKRKPLAGLKNERGEQKPREERRGQEESRGPLRCRAQWGARRRQQTEPEGGRGEASEEKEDPRTGGKRRGERKTTGLS